jgi:hypothetical protein
MTQIRFRGSVTFRALLDRSPSQFGVPELPGVGLSTGYQAGRGAVDRPEKKDLDKLTA